MDTIGNIGIHWFVCTYMERNVVILCGSGGTGRWFKQKHMEHTYRRQTFQGEVHRRA